jgi:hypothetical protein
VRRCRLHKSYHRHSVKPDWVKRMDSIDAVKRRSKNGFDASSNSSYDVPY